MLKKFMVKLKACNCGAVKRRAAVSANGGVLFEEDVEVDKYTFKMANFYTNISDLRKIVKMYDRRKKK